MIQRYAIGGSSSVGKSTLARALADRCGLAVVSVDTMGAGDLTDDPAHSWTQPAPYLLTRLCAHTARLRPTLASSLHRLAERGVPVVVEGEGVEPHVMSQFVTQGWRVAYVVEDDADVLADTLASRPGGERFRALQAAEQHGVVQMNLAYGAWLRAAATRHGQPWVASRPWDTVVSRVAKCLHAPVPARRTLLDPSG